MANFDAWQKANEYQKTLRGISDQNCRRPASNSRSVDRLGEQERVSNAR